LPETGNGHYRGCPSGIHAWSYPNDAFLILDEAQNTTREQNNENVSHAYGVRSRAVITGDVTQIDLPPVNRAFLKEGEQEGKPVQALSMP
jgi:phosphate starvation-inducible PhoH-like protein